MYLAVDLVENLTSINFPVYLHLKCLQLNSTSMAVLWFFCSMPSSGPSGQQKSNTLGSVQFMIMSYISYRLVIPSGRNTRLQSSHSSHTMFLWAGSKAADSRGERRYLILHGSPFQCSFKIILELQKVTFSEEN